MKRSIYALGILIFDMFMSICAFINVLAEAFKLELKSSFRIVVAPFKSLRDGTTDEIKNANRANIEN